MIIGNEMGEKYDKFAGKKIQLHEVDDQLDVNVSLSNVVLENNDTNNSYNDMEISIDQAVYRIGVGKFQSQMLFVAGWYMLHGRLDGNHSSFVPFARIEERVELD